MPEANSDGILFWLALQRFWVLLESRKTLKAMRSANNANVSDICASMGGGGHVKAAGCLLHGTLDEVKKQIVDAVAKGIKSC